MKYLIVLLVISGCAVQTDWIATGGSKSDGVVELSHNSQPYFFKAETDESQAVAVASDACSAWGFDGARAFGGTTRECVSRDANNQCSKALYTKKYQCTD